MNHLNRDALHAWADPTEGLVDTEPAPLDHKRQLQAKAKPAEAIVKLLFFVLLLLSCIEAVSLVVTP
jgi:hypothetical protein